MLVKLEECIKRKKNWIKNKQNEDKLMVNIDEEGQITLWNNVKGGKLYLSRSGNKVK